MIPLCTTAGTKRQGLIAVLRQVRPDGEREALQGWGWESRRVANGSAPTAQATPPARRDWPRANMAPAATGGRRAARTGTGRWLIEFGASGLPLCASGHLGIRVRSLAPFEGRVSSAEAFWVGCFRGFLRVVGFF